MGIYTGLRGTILFLPVVAELMRAWKEDRTTKLGIWEFVFERLPEDTPGEVRESLRRWKMVLRANFIPNGALAYMPSDWEEHHREWEGDRLHFTCSLKNYEGEIEEFIEEVLPHIAAAWDLERRYEEDEESTFFSFAKERLL